MEMKKVLLVGALAVLALAMARSCDRNGATLNAANAVDAVTKEVKNAKAEVKEEMAEVKEKLVAKPHKKASARVAKKVRVVRKPVLKSTAPKAAAVVEEDVNLRDVGTKAVSSYPSSDHHKANRYVFEGQAK